MVEIHIRIAASQFADDSHVVIEMSRLPQSTVGPIPECLGSSLRTASIHSDDDEAKLRDSLRAVKAEHFLQQIRRGAATLWARVRIVDDGVPLGWVEVRRPEEDTVERSFAIRR